MIPPAIATKETVSRLSKSSVRKKPCVGMRKAPFSALTTSVMIQVEIVKYSTSRKAVLVTVKALEVCKPALYRFSR